MATSQEGVNILLDAKTANGGSSSVYVDGRPGAIQVVASDMDARVNVRASLNRRDWVTVDVTDASGISADYATAPGVYYFGSGFGWIAASITDYVAGTISVYYQVARSASGATAAAGGGGGGAVTGTHEWSALGSAVTGILGADVAPTLKGLANNANKLGSEFDNSLSANRAQYADFELLCRGAAAMTAGAVLKLWLVEALDGTNYEDGDDSTIPARSPEEQFYVRAVATAQRITVRGVLLPPTKFKPLLRNESGQALTSTDGENLLRMRTYKEEIA